MSSTRCTYVGFEIELELKKSIGASNFGYYDHHIRPKGESKGIYRVSAAVVLFEHITAASKVEAGTTVRINGLEMRSELWYRRQDNLKRKYAIRISVIHFSGFERCHESMSFLNMFSNKLAVTWVLVQAVATCGVYNRM
eukprot:scaffold27646_cov36-Prasinocladus_malaysianus.AAC.1